MQSILQGHYNFSSQPTHLNIFINVFIWKRINKKADNGSSDCFIFVCTVSKENNVNGLWCKKESTPYSKIDIWVQMRSGVVKSLLSRKTQQQIGCGVLLLC